MLKALLFSMPVYNTLLIIQLVRRRFFENGSGDGFLLVVVDFDGDGDDDDAGFDCWLLWAVLVFRGQAGL